MNSKINSLNHEITTLRNKLQNEEEAKNKLMQDLINLKSQLRKLQEKIDFEFEINSILDWFCELNNVMSSNELIYKDFAKKKLNDDF